MSGIQMNGDTNEKLVNGDVILTTDRGRVMLLNVTPEGRLEIHPDIIEAIATAVVEKLSELRKEVHD